MASKNADKSSADGSWWGSTCIEVCCGKRGVCTHASVCPQARAGANMCKVVEEGGEHGRYQCINCAMKLQATRWQQCSTAHHASASGRLIPALVSAGRWRGLLPAGPGTQEPGPPAPRPAALLFSLLLLLRAAHDSTKLLLLALRLA